jgi:hypothetical protein
MGEMRKLISVLLCLVLALLLLPYGSGRASVGVSDIWQLDYADDTCAMLLQAAQDCSLCHTSVPAVNPYGQDISDPGFGWFGIEWLDSDGDGRTNGEEIRNDCSLPGDAISPIEKTSWSRIKALFRQ